MKKLIALALCLVMAMSLFAGCKKAVEEPVVTEAPVVTDAPATELEATEEPAPEAAAAKTGIAIVTGVSGSTAAGEEDGAAKTEATVVAVTVDANGVITGCTIDSLQATINFSKEGKLTTDAATAAFPTKQELGASYGMAAASAIGKEWNEQVDALAAYCIGKTIDEVKGMALTESMTPADADLAAGCTIHVTGLIDAIAKAVENAQELGASTTDKVGLAAVTGMSKSKDAAADAEGVAQAYSTYAAVTVNAEGKITSCIIDAVQANVKFDAAGAITNDIAAAVATKNELGAAYGMAAASAIGKEWNEQAAAFAAYCVGKTADEVSATALDETGLAADADLIASVTIHVGDFMSVVAKAVANAK